jgi:predicted anti-sigma-YlaC factor YlaD
MIVYIGTTISSMVIYDVVTLDILTRNNGLGIALACLLLCKMLRPRGLLGLLRLSLDKFDRVRYVFAWRPHL